MAHTYLCGERDDARVGEEMNELMQLAMGKSWVKWVIRGFSFMVFIYRAGSQAEDVVEVGLQTPENKRAKQEGGCG